jgi:8-amino-7-oxononanoate synthase
MSTSDMSGQDSRLDQHLNIFLAQRRQEHALREISPPDKSRVDFSSNDYLSLTRENLLEETVARLLSPYKTRSVYGSGGSRLLTGDHQFLHETELTLAEFFRGESALLFPSGYLANLGLMQALPKRGDTIIYDKLIHASIRDGIRLSMAQSWAFEHHDYVHLEALLAKASGAKWVVVESLYSMDGDFTDLKQLVEICDKYNAFIILDEAHSTGVFGVDGEGCAVLEELHEAIDVRLYTFGKAAGVHGAAVVGSARLKQYLINFARPIIYSTAISLHEAAVILAAVDCFKHTGASRQKLFALLNEPLIAGSTALKGDSQSPIRYFPCAGNEAVTKLAADCLAEGFDVRAIKSPTVPQGEERLRIILHAHNTLAEIQTLLNLLR